MRRITVGLLAIVLTACNILATASPTLLPTTTTAIPENLPAVEGPAPSSIVASFYYPWYGNPATDGEWIHWTEEGFPRDITSDYFPVLEAYSSNDRQVVAQHMAWLRQAGVGVIIASWWGQGCREEKPVPLLLEMGEHYGIKLAFHIEPYHGRNADRLLSDVKYLNLRYGSHPAYFHSTASSRYSPGEDPKPMFFMWDVSEAESGGEVVPPSYWQAANDAIHALPQGGLMIADQREGRWVSEGHFDGLYNYATLHLEQEGGFDWAATLPPDSLYIPSVIPGFAARRINYTADTYVPREDGKIYSDQWTSALGTPVKPEMVTVTSFNEWHEGTMIEPAAVDVDNGSGYIYDDYGSLPPEGYLDLTRQWVETFLGTTWPEAYKVRIKLSTTSDWTTLGIASGGRWIRPELVSVSGGVDYAGMEGTGNLALTQPIAQAEGGAVVEMTWDLLLSSMDPEGDLIMNIERGDMGATTLTIYNYLGDAPVEIHSWQWAGISADRNSFHVSVAVAQLMNANP